MAGNTNEDPVLLLMMILAMVGLLCWLVWHFFEPQFLEGIRYLRLVELAPFALVDHQAAYCMSWLWRAPVGLAVPTEAVYNATLGCFGVEAIKDLPINARPYYYNVTTDSLGFIGDYVGKYLRWLVLIACGWFAYYAGFVSKKNGFKTRHNLESFIKVQSQIWPVITPITNFSPTKHSARILGSEVPDKIPLFAEPFAPEEWLSFHRVPVVNGVPDREAVRRAFCLQLGPRWSSYTELPPYMQALAAAFALKGVQRREESDEFLGRISVCWSAEKGYRLTPELLSEIKSILKDPEVGGKALAIANKHAYRTTSMIGLLKWARFMGGVLAAAQFLWLRGVDRDLWYALNNQGRRSFHTEGAGSIAHFMAEEQAGKALPIPRMDTAIVTLNIYMGGDTPVQVPPRQEPSKARI